MGDWLSTLVRPLVAAALLGATLAGLGSMGWWFWQNRECSPCATAGLDDVSIEAEAPLTPAVVARVRDAALLGGALGIGVALFWVLPPAIRLRRVTREDQPAP